MPSFRLVVLPLLLALPAHGQPAAPPVPLAPGALEVRISADDEARNLLPNASFERAEGGVPARWLWDRRNTDATLALVEPGHFGRRAVRVTNGTAFGPHVYAHLRVENVPVVPEQIYTLSFYCRTQGDPGTAWVGGATDWRVRARIPRTNGTWQRVSESFRTRPGETLIPIMVLTESPTAGFDVDDVQLELGAAAAAFQAPDTALPPQVALGYDGLASRHGRPWKPDVYTPGQWAFVGHELALGGGLSVPERVPGGAVEVRVSEGEGELARQRVAPEGGLPPHAAVQVRYGLPAEPPEQLTVAVRLVDGDRELAAQRFELRVVTPGQVEAILRRIEQALPALEQRAATDDDARVTASTARMFLGYVRDDLGQGEIGRAYDAAQETEGLVAAAMLRPVRPPAPRFVTSPLTIDGPSFVGTVALLDGTRAQRPVWFTGYGHFGTVRRMVDQFPAFGHNLIQIEFGPNSVLVGENEVSDQAIRDFLAVCDRAAAANVQVNLLLSPHYFPGWALDKWPHLRDCSGGFLGYCVHAPEAQAVLERSLRYVIPRIKDHPALHSLCLSNEPISVDLSGCAEAKALWHAWLRARYASLEAVNARWGTQHASWEAIPVPPPRFEPEPLRVDFVAFNQETFAGWHRWMAGIIRELAPQVPVHAKIMVAAHFQRSLHGVWSVAPELFGELSDINGNDCVKWPGATGEWACGWVGENMGYDYQRSAADKPIFNSENHLIPDRFLGDVSAEFIRNVFWQGAIHGQGATTTWVWERTFDPDHDFAGSILHRPKCVEAAGLATLDLNRAAVEVDALARQPAPVAILWSQTSTLLRGDDHAREVSWAYTAANFLDVPVGFINERDCAAYAAGQPNRAFGAARLVLVPGASHVTPAVVEALTRFAAAGGRVLRLGPCFTHDDANRPLSAAAVGEELPAVRGSEVRALWQRLRDEATKAGVQPLGAVNRWGVEARSAQVGEGTVLNLCNYRAEPAEVSLPAGCIDVLTGERLPATLTLPPLATRLVGVRLDLG